MAAKRTGGGATAGTPADVVSRLSSEIRKVLALPEIKNALAQQGAEPASDTPEEFAAIARADVDKWARIVKQTGAKPDYSPPAVPSSLQRPRIRATIRPVTWGAR